MSETALISIVGITVSGVIGPSAAALWARWRQAREHDHDRRAKAHDDLVELLDEAARLLATGATRMRSAWEASKQGNEDPGFTDWASEVHATYERILLRLPEADSVSQRYRAARDRLAAVGEALPEAAPDEADEAIKDFEAARSSFLEAARRRLHLDLASG